jgi:hypothetical protein
MADNKKTSVFGIFNSMSAADFATESCIRGGFTAADISALIPENLSWEGRSDCSQASARLRFQGLVLSSQRGR